MGSFHTRMNRSDGLILIQVYKYVKNKHILKARLKMVMGGNYSYTIEEAVRNCTVQLDEASKLEQLPLSK